VIGDRKPRRTRRPLWRLIVSVGLALLLLAWLIVTRPRVLRDALQPVATTTPTASSLQTALPRPSPTTSPTPKPAVQLYHLGNTQHLDNIWLTPTKVVTVSHVNGYDLNEGEIVLVAYLRIENRNNQNFTVSLGHFTVLDHTSGAIYTHLDTDPSRHRLRPVTLIPGGHTEGTVAFAIPMASHALELFYSPDILLPLHRKTWLLNTR